MIDVLSIELFSSPFLIIITGFSVWGYDRMLADEEESLKEKGKR
jgi:hypothetical protein